MAPAGAASHDRAGFTVPGTAVAHGADAVAPGRPGRVTQLFQCGERRLRTPDMNRRWMVWESVFAGGGLAGESFCAPARRDGRCFSVRSGRGSARGRVRKNKKGASEAGNDLENAFVCPFVGCYSMCILHPAHFVKRGPKKSVPRQPLFQHTDDPFAGKRLTYSHEPYPPMSRVCIPMDDRPPSHTPKSPLLLSQDCLTKDASCAP
jgi:hypothetical protein